MMKTLSTLIVVLTLTANCFAQHGIIKGRVIEARSFKPLSFATVYLNQTTIGTLTNEEGDFQLENIPAGTYDLAVTYIGYQVYQSRVNVNDTVPLAVSIKMVVATTNLDEVLVKAKKDAQWNVKYDKFEKQFFGVSPFSKDCRILNPWVLDFKEDDKGNLTAQASLPVEIENLGLGYLITCTLKEFVVGPNLYKISGLYRFQEAVTNDSTLRSSWNSRRLEVYRGSQRHLMKAIVDNRVTEEGFDLYADISNNVQIIRNSNFLQNVNASIKQLPATGLSQADGMSSHKLLLPKRTEVHYLKRSAPGKIYRNVLHPISWIEINGGTVDVNNEGVVMNPNRVVAMGAMSEARVAELLPIDFKPKQSAIIKEESQQENPYSKLAALLEKPYLMTDKPYYYPSDAILFKAFFNYISPVYRDSLSHVMHVELIDASQKIVQTKMLPIIAGISYGDFALTNKIKPGDYTLRAYTRWMLNFSKQLIFSKAIKVLPLDQLAKPTPVYPVSQQLEILTEKEEFATREKITVAIEAVDFYDKPVAADIAISVTDLEQAGVPVRERNIIGGYQFTKEMLPDTSLKTPKYFIQQGIDFKGQFVVGKKNKGIPGVLTVYQEAVNDVFGIPTDETGRFSQQLQLMDSVELLIGAKTLKGARGKVIMDPVDEPVPSIELAPVLNLETYKPKDPSKYHVVDAYSTAKMLESVTIEARRIEKISADKKHIMSDSHIEGDALRATNATDLLSALRGRVPGLQVLYFKDPITGDPIRFIGFSGIVNLNGLAEALVEIDGIVLSNFGGQSVADQLAAMGTQDIESIDVLRFGSAAAYGARAANGVIVVKTRSGNKIAAGRPKLDRSKLQVVNMAGYSTPLEFESPDYSEHTNGDDRSDYRSTIYWNPTLVTDGKEPLMVTFYAADVPTKYRIVVEGVTAEGQPVRGEKIIVVTDKK